MRDDEQPDGDRHSAIDSSGLNTADTAPDADQDDPASSDESITDELAALLDDGRTYAEAEIAFQKTRAKLAGVSVGKAIAFALIALITLHISVLALAVGMVIALEPIVTIWGAIAIVVGVLVALTLWLALMAKRQGSKLSVLFGSSEGGSGR